MSDDSPRSTPSIGEALPRPQEAVISAAKLRDYALNSDHPKGRAKARVFASVLGITEDSWELLRDELLRALPEGRIYEIMPGPHATTYRIRLVTEGLDDGAAPVVTAWKLVDWVPHLASVRIDGGALSG